MDYSTSTSSFFSSLQASTSTHACARSSSWTFAGSTGCRSCTTCAPQSARRRAAPTRRATPTRRTRTAFLRTACRGCCWDSAPPRLPAVSSIFQSITVINIHPGMNSAFTHVEACQCTNGVARNTWNVRRFFFISQLWKYVFGRKALIPFFLISRASLYRSQMTLKYPLWPCNNLHPPSLASCEPVKELLF